MSNLSKPYTISIWDEVWNENEGKFVEERFAVIGANTMQSQNRALEPTLTRNVNGSKKFSFKMCKRYKDSITGEVVINPFAEYLISERKIKLEYDGEWFDFIIKNISEDSSKYIYTYQCEDALVNELAKNGFGVTLDSESVNNSGTLKEIAETVLEDTDWEVESDVIVQTVEEPLVYIQIPAGTTITPVLDQDENNKANGVTQKTPIKLTKDSRVLAFYSSCRNKPIHFQFIYFADESKYGKGAVEHNEDRVVVEKDCQYYIEYLDPEIYKAQVQDDYGFILPKGFSVIAQSGGTDDTADTTISTWHRGARYVFSQESIYEPKLKRYVTKHKKGSEEYRSYTSSEYISPELVLNIITNTNFKSNNGWTGTHFSTKGSAKATTEAVYGRFDGNKFISAIDDLSNGGSVYDAEYDNHKAYMKLVMPAGSYVVNSGPYDNRVSIGQMEIGSEWAVSILSKDESELTGVTYELGEYEYDAFTNGYKEINSGIKFTKQTSKEGYTIFKVTSNPYLNKKEFKEDSNVRLRIKNTSSEEITRYVLSATLFRVHYTKNGKLVVPGEEPANQDEVIGFVENKYYYYKPSELDNFTEESDFQPSVSLDKPTFEIYEPIFHMDAEKIRSVTAKESNYFNILQTLAETFETWMLIDVERNESGQITKKKIKYKQYIGEKNYANFRYGVNLKDIKRTFESKALVTKLIVKDNSNEFAKNGFCTVARAKANPLGENCLYDFQYYFNTGIMNARDHLDTMYSVDGAMGKDRPESHSTTNALGYYPRIRAINDKLDTISDSIAALNTGLVKLKAEAEVEKAAREAAETSIEEAADGFAYLTGCDIRNFAKSDIEEYESRSDVHKQLTAYTTCMTELNRATKALEKLEATITERENKIKKEQTDFDTWRNYKIALNKAFYTKYSRFIQEGTWIDEEYVDDEKYYADAQSVLYNSCYPQVTYSINVLALSALPGYELFKFGLGDRTFVEDPEFFGREYKEEVVLTEFQENLDSPEKNTIKVQNFKNQFQDLFQKITATVQQAQYRAGSYEKAAALAEAAAAKKYQFLTDALAGAEAILTAAGQQTVIVDKSGITVTDDDAPCNQIRLIGGAILISTDDGNGVKKWKTAMTHQGISASLITAGVINAGEICIMNSEEPAFRWDAFGLTAFDATWYEGVASGSNFTKFVRMDKYGLYGMNGKDPKNNVTPDGRTWHAQEVADIDKYATFALTWDGLKVVGGDGVVARIGRYSGNIINITKQSDTSSIELFKITNAGVLTINAVNSQFKVGSDSIEMSVANKYAMIMDEEGFRVNSADGTSGISVGAGGLTVRGKIFAKEGGEIGGFYIYTSYLSSNKNKTTYNDATQDGVYIGPGGIGLGKGTFYVTSSGSLHATGADISGAIYASEGTIGDFTLTSDGYLYSNGKISLTTDAEGVYIGDDGIGLGSNFKVTSAGYLTAKSGQLGNVTLNGNGLTAGGISLNSSGISSTYFSANSSGATINGTVTATAGTIGGCSIKEGKLWVGAAHIEGTLTVGQLPDTMAQKTDLPTLLSQLTNDMDFKNGTQVTTITNDTIKTTSVVAQNLVVKAAHIDGKLTIGQLADTVAQKSDIPSALSAFTNDMGFASQLDITNALGGISFGSSGSSWLGGYWDNQAIVFKVANSNYGRATAQITASYSQLGFDHSSKISIGASTITIGKHNATNGKLDWGFEMSSSWIRVYTANNTYTQYTWADFVKGVSWNGLFG